MVQIHRAKPEFDHHSPAHRQADTRRASTFVHLHALRRSGETPADLCACTSYSVFKEPACAPARELRRGLRLQAAAHPAWWGSQKQAFRPCSGEPSYTTTAISGCQHALSHCDTLSPVKAKADAGSGVGNLPSWCPTWEPGNPGAWGRTPKANLDTTRRRWACQPVDHHCLRAISPLSPVAPDPGARHVTAAFHTASQPVTRTSRVRGRAPRCQPAGRSPADARSRRRE